MSAYNVPAENWPIFNSSDPTKANYPVVQGKISTLGITDSIGINSSTITNSGNLTSNNIIANNILTSSTINNSGTITSPNINSSGTITSSTINNSGNLNSTNFCPFSGTGLNFNTNSTNSMLVYSNNASSIF